VEKGTRQQPALKGRNPVIDLIPPLQGLTIVGIRFTGRCPVLLMTGLLALNLSLRPVQTAPCEGVSKARFTVIARSKTEAIQFINNDLWIASLRSQ
jgi:hypothetical protein